MRFIGLTASSDDAICRWREMTGAEYDFCITDGTTLKTIIRSNPGLVLLKEGRVVGKWSHNDLPDPQSEEFKSLLADGFAEGTAQTAKKLFKVTLWFFIPLLLLTLADRLWAWTKWVRKSKE